MATDILFLCLQVLIGLWLADFGTGFVHWLADNYGNPKWPVLGPRHIVYSHNHHHDPHELARLSWHARHGGIWTVVALTTLALWFIGWLGPVTLSALLFGALTNMMHRWSHQSPRQNGPIITALMRLGLVQSQRHHVHHHSGQNDTHYCLLTDHVNPVVEYIQLWPRLERLLSMLGIERHWWKRRGLPV